mmetsp:Transcript_14507/g.33505  ORF Transcript_14507/g.33505 Transcript_14507/m.33505 type:complete len:243 (+) Transcript_14507:132-860(+)
MAGSRFTPSRGPAVFLRMMPWRKYKPRGWRTRSLGKHPQRFGRLALWTMADGWQLVGMTRHSRSGIRIGWHVRCTSCSHPSSVRASLYCHLIRAVHMLWHVGVTTKRLPCWIFDTPPLPSSKGHQPWAVGSGESNGTHKMITGFCWQPCTGVAESPGSNQIPIYKWRRNSQNTKAWLMALTGWWTIKSKQLQAVRSTISWSVFGMPNDSGVSSFVEWDHLFRFLPFPILHSFLDRWCSMEAR